VVSDVSDFAAGQTGAGAGASVELQAGAEQESNPDLAAVTAILARLLVGVDHVGFAVPDLDAAVSMWSAMGLQEVQREENPAQGIVEVMMSVGAGTTLIQLLASTSSDSAIASWLTNRGPGIQQVAFTVTNVVAAADALRALGCEVLYDQPRRGTHNSLINFVHPKSCGGVLVELVEHTA
jgi:methylmalonyl-CoA/ethylmalonyl-CoA epimerase